MNYPLVAKYLGFLIFALALLMIPSILCAVYYQEWDALKAFLISLGITAVIAGLMLMLGRKAAPTMFQREALLMVSMSWIVAAAIGAIPYVVMGSLGIVDAYFESMSGFTTTGSTVIQDIEAQPKSLLFWRSLSQWLGGVGVVMMAIAVLPYLGAGGKQLFKGESSGENPRSMSPRIKDTAQMLYRAYLTLTISMTLLLMMAGMGFYDAVCHTMSTISSGGFSTRQSSIAAFDSVAIETIIIAFMLIAGTSFSLIFVVFNRDWKALFRDTEWRVFIGIFAAVTGIATLNVYLGTPNVHPSAFPDDPHTLGYSLRIAAFQVTSTLTGTGFNTHDYTTWPHLSIMILFVIMFFGGCAGSTTGGLKVVRLVMLSKIVYWRVENTFRPKTVRAVRVNDYVIDDETRKSVNAFFVIYIGWFVFGSVFMTALGLPFESAMGSVAATLNNIGPGLGSVGPSNDFSQVPAIGKLFLSMCMALGRLELFSICVLLIPGFWRHA